MQAEVVPASSMVFRNVTRNELEEVAGHLLNQMGDLRICSLEGEMGAGKTTFMKAVGKVLHVKDSMSSPTFAIVNEYMTDRQLKIYHIDCYRLKSEAEARELGMEEYFYSGNYCFIEWAERIPSLMPQHYMQVSISPEDETHRTIEFLIHGREEKDGV